jgi:hypothetical protein
VASNDLGGAEAVRTPLCEKLGIERPIVQAPMAAVPQADRGGLERWRTRRGDADLVRRCRGRHPGTAALTTQPFGGNFPMLAGQSVGLVSQPQSAAEIVAELTASL